MFQKTSVGCMIPLRKFRELRDTRMKKTMLLGSESITWRHSRPTRFHVGGLPPDPLLCCKASLSIRRTHRHLRAIRGPKYARVSSSTDCRWSWEKFVLPGTKRIRDGGLGFPGNGNHKTPSVVFRLGWKRVVSLKRQVTSQYTLLKGNYGKPIFRVR